MEKEHLKEAGKHLLNIAVAIIVFAVIQPAVNKEFDVLVAVISIAFYLVIFSIGIYLIKKGQSEEKDES